MGTFQEMRKAAAAGADALDATRDHDQPKGQTDFHVGISERANHTSGSADSKTATQQQEPVIRST